MQPCGGRRHADQPGHDERRAHDHSQEPEELQRLDRDAGGAEDVEPWLGLGQAVEQDRRGPDPDQDDVLAVPAAEQQPRCERSSRDPLLGRITDETRTAPGGPGAGTRR